MTKTIFWNVDTQYDFIEEDGELAIPAATEIKPNLGYLTRLAAEREIKVVSTCDMHDGDSEEISKNPDYKTTFPEHCMRGTKGAGFVAETCPNGAYFVDWKENLPSAEDPKIEENFALDIHYAREIVVTKDKFDVFTGSPYTERVLDIINPDRAIVYGVATNVCVDYAVMGLLERGVEVIVPTDAIKELPGLPLEKILNKWTDAGAKLVKTEEVERYLQ